MVSVYKNVITSQEISSLLEYYFAEDERTESRPDVRSKHPRWDIDAWPQDIVTNILDRVLDKKWYPETTLFMESKIQGQGFRLHVDTADGRSNLYKNVLIPLLQEGEAATAFFSNFWQGPSTRFSKTPNSPFTYPMISSDDQVIIVDDIRVLLDKCKNDPESVTDFNVDERFVDDLERLVSEREGNGLAPVDQRTSDYSQIKGYDPTKKFDTALHQRYLNHIDIENLHGLTVDQIVHWEIGSVIVFPRSQIHCATSTHCRKIGLSIFTDYAD